MKQLKSFIFIALSLMALNACKKEAATDNKVLINFINLTGATIQNASADSVPVGNIANNGQTGFIAFERFGTDTGMPDSDFTGKRNNTTLKSTSDFYWCGTEKSQLEPGRYNIEIKLYNNGTSQYFDLRFK
jgi:hypothetical protein